MHDYIVLPPATCHFRRLVPALSRKCKPPHITMRKTMRLASTDAVRTVLNIRNSCC